MFISSSTSYSEEALSSLDTSAERSPSDVRSIPSVETGIEDTRERPVSTKIEYRNRPLHPSSSHPYAPSASCSSLAHPISSPLRPSSVQNLPSTMDSGVTVETGKDLGGGRQLKRLSLLSKPTLSPTTSTASSSRRSSEETRIQEDTIDETESWDAGPSTPRAPIRRPPDRSKGMRSSISYAPSPTTSLRSPAQIDRHEGLDGNWKDRRSDRQASSRNDEEGRSERVGRIGSGLGSLQEEGVIKTPRSSDGCIALEEPSKATKGLTLAEKHADLLTLIAQKERRVNELKLELAQQETALKNLKEKWTTIATRTSRPFTTQLSGPSSSSNTVPQRQSSSTPASLPMPSRRSARPQPLKHYSAQSVSSTSSEPPLSPTSPTSSSDPYSPLQIGTEDQDPTALIGPGAQAVLNNLLATAYGPEGVVTPSAVEGGKRFWGQLVKTVSAAAAGNVPGEEGPGIVGSGAASAGGTLDVATLKNMVSLSGWASLIPAPASSSTPRPIRQPANVNRLPRNRDHSETSSDSVSLKSPVLTTPSLDNGNAVPDTNVPGLGRVGGSGMSSFQDLLDLDGGSGTDMKSKASGSLDDSEGGSVKGDEWSDDGWGF